jgi:hypothetical protein
MEKANDLVSSDPLSSDPSKNRGHRAFGFDQLRDAVGEQQSEANPAHGAVFPPIVNTINAAYIRAGIAWNSSYSFCCAFSVSSLLNERWSRGRGHRA